MLLERNEHDKALTVFELNKELNPEIPNTFDSLAEAYYLSGNKEAGKALFTEMSQKFPDFMDYENRLKEIEQESNKR
ncbi:tetratricopeptide repeat protein [Alteromonas gracilis]|uniref:tetratricopeptide repeat protein n=1 Tax=Alteromonas gracilis TaxID=1479524 RepID=UPI0030D4AF95